MNLEGLQSRFVYLSIFVFFIFTITAFTIQDAHATGGTVSDGSSCLAIGGAWNGVDTCIVSSLTINSGETITINSGIILVNTDTINIDNSGTLINSGTIDNNLTILNSGTINNSGGTINLSGSINNPSISSAIINSGIILNTSTININFRGTIINNGTIDNPGIINNKCGAVYSGIQPTGNLVNNVSCTLSDGLSCEAIGGAWNGADTCTVSFLTIDSGDALTINSGIVLTHSGPIYNSGTINISAGSTINNDNFGQAIWNNSGGTIYNSGTISSSDIRNSGTINNSNIINKSGVFTNDHIIDNSGSITILNNSSIQNNFGGSIINHGTIQINNFSAIYNSDTITNDGIITNDGTINNNSGGTITNLSGGTINNNSIGTITNNGTTTINCGSTYTNNGLVNGSNPVNIILCAHHTVLTLNPISNVLWGSSITISGSLNDTDASNLGVGSAIISFAGSNGTIITSVTTGGNGKFSQSDFAPGAPAKNNWQVIASYTGNSTFLAAPSVIQSYNTLKHPTSISNPTLNPTSVPWGQTFTANSTLTDLTLSTPISGATIIFDGNGTTGIITQITNSDGSVQPTITAPGIGHVGLGKVNATFAGNLSYLPSGPSTSTLTITKHATSLSIANQGNVFWSAPVTGSGNITDTDLSTRVSGLPIIFAGNGSSSLTPVSTAGPAGSYTSSGPSPGSPAKINWIINSTFAGNANYNAAFAFDSYNTLVHPVSLSTNDIQDVKWGFTIIKTGNATDTFLGTRVAGLPIIFTGNGSAGLPEPITTISPYGSYTSSGPSPGAPAKINWIINSTFAGNTSYGQAFVLDNYNTIKHTTSLSLDFIPDPIQGTAFNAKGNSLVDLDLNIGIKGKTITFDGTGVGSPPLAPATTGGINFTGSGLEIVSCPSCSPNPGTSDPITKSLKAQTGTSFTLPLGSSVVSVTVQNSNNNPFTLTGTNVDGNNCSQSASDSSPNITTVNLDCGGPSISHADFSVGGTGSLKVTQVKTFKPSTVDSNLITANFENKPTGFASSITVADGAYASTTTSVNSVTLDPQIVQAHFAEDNSYFAADSNTQQYHTQLALGVGGSVTATENYVKSYTAQDCGVNDADGDALCNNWETTGVPYTAGGVPYNYIIPGTPNQNKKNINVELDAMTGYAPSLAAGGPIDRVKTAFANAPVTNVAGQTNGILLNVVASDTSLVLEPSLDVWVDFDGNANDDFGTIKGRFFGTTAERPVLAGTQVNGAPASGSLLSFTTTISGVTISPPSNTVPNTEGTIFFKQNVTIGAAGINIGAATASKTNTNVGTSLTFGNPTVEVITPNALTPTKKILLVKQPFSMASGYTTVNNPVGTITLTIPMSAATTLSLAAPPIPATLTTTLLDAKAQTTHYSMFVKSIGACGPSGLGESKGNDFIISLGCGFTGTTGSADEIAGTFMHELGHNLGLGHGGPSEIAGASVSDSSQNCKPLYASIMSYSRQLPTYFTAGDFKLDYSRGYFATPAISLAEQQLDEQLGLRANTTVASDIPKIVYGTPGLQVTARTASAAAALANPTAIDWNANGITESLTGTHTLTNGADHTVGPSADTGTFILSNIKATTGAGDNGGQVTIRTFVDFGGVDPGPVTASATASMLNSFGPVSGFPTATISGVGDVRIVDVTLRFTRTGAIADADLANITVTISGATTAATFTTTEGPAQVNVAYATTTSTSKIAKVRGPEITTSTSGTITITQKATLATAARLTPSALTQTVGTPPAGLTWGLGTISSVTSTGLPSATNSDLIHIITITQPFTIAAGSSVTAVSMGELTYTMSFTSSPTNAAFSVVLSKIETNTNSPSLVRVDANNFGITGCSASTNNVPYNDYNDWVNLKYNFRGAAGTLFNAREAPHEPNGSEVQQQINSKNKYGGVLQPLNQNTIPPSDMSRVKVGQTVPIKFQLRDANGNIVSNAQVTFVAKATGKACGTDVIDEVLPNVGQSTGTLFTFTASTINQYTYNWKIPSNWPTGETGLNFINNYGSSTQEVLTHFDTASQHNPYSLKVCVRK